MKKKQNEVQPTKEEIEARMVQIDEIKEMFPEMKHWRNLGYRHLRRKIKELDREMAQQTQS